MRKTVSGCGRLNSQAAKTLQIYWSIKDKIECLFSILSCLGHLQFPAPFSGNVTLASTGFFIMIYSKIIRLLYCIMHILGIILAFCNEIVSTALRDWQRDENHVK